jgi:hypothetical protein
MHIPNTLISKVMLRLPKYDTMPIIGCLLINCIFRHIAIFVGKFSIPSVVYNAIKKPIKNPTKPVMIQLRLILSNIFSLGVPFL